MPFPLLCPSNGTMNKILCMDSGRVYEVMGRVGDVLLCRHSETCHSPQSAIGEQSTFLCQVPEVPSYLDRSANLRPIARGTHLLSWRISRYNAFTVFGLYRESQSLLVAIVRRPGPSAAAGLLASPGYAHRDFGTQRSTLSMNSCLQFSAIL